MATIVTDNLKVFPSTRRAQTKPQARLMSEQAIVGLVNKLISKEGFVISSEVGMTATDTLDFNIYGYYFSILNPASSIGLGTTFTSGQIYAHIEIVTNTATDGLVYEELWGQDDSGNFTGLEIDSTPNPESKHDGVVKSLLIIDWDAEQAKWIVPESSRVRFDKSSLDLSVIDGGIII